jgi:hypothetical protein
MSLVLQVTVAGAAILFIAVSALMNALFLSSLGRTPVEVGLLAAVSIASDMIKAVLPVLLLRAVMVRAWSHCALASVMLTAVMALSLASGTGFAALTRNAAVTVRGAQADELAARLKELRDIEAGIEGLAPSRQTAVVEAAIAGLTIDRHWIWSKSCTDITGPAARKFCTGFSSLKSELALATSRDQLTAKRNGTRSRIDVLQLAGAGGDSDPQAVAIASLLGVDKSTPRLVLPVSIAVVLELGGVILVLLLAGPTLIGWREPGTIPKPAPSPVEVPMSADRTHWQRQRNKASLNGNRGESHER